MLNQSDLPPKGVWKRLEQFESIGDQKENGNGATDIVQIQSVISGPVRMLLINNQLIVHSQINESFNHQFAYYEFSGCTVSIIQKHEVHLFAYNI